MSEAINPKWITIEERTFNPEKRLEVKIQLCDCLEEECLYRGDYKLYDSARVVAQKVCDYDSFPVKDVRPACGYESNNKTR